MKDRIIEPMPGVLLCELALSEYGNIPVPEKDHDSMTWAIVRAINETDVEHYGYLMGRTVHFRKYRDDAKIRETKLVFIEIKDVLGSTLEIDKE